MIDKELDLLQIWGDYIGFTPVIGSFYGGMQSGLPRLLPSRDIAKRLPRHGFVWVHLDAVDALLAQSETQHNPFRVDIQLTFQTRHEFQDATLIIPLENVRALLNALSTAIRIIHEMDLPRPESFALLRFNQAERYIAINARHANETPFPIRYRRHDSVPED